MSDRVLAERIVDGIIKDFTDRRGLRQEWEQVDEEMQAEVREAWVQIVLGLLPEPEAEQQ